MALGARRDSAAQGARPLRAVLRPRRCRYSTCDISWRCARSAISFTRAASHCGVTQPTQTQAIKQLETELGGALFERNGRTSSLTALGAAVRPHIAAVSAASERVLEAAALVGSGTPPVGSEFILPGHAPVMRKVAILAAAAVALLLAAGALNSRSCIRRSPPSMRPRARQSTSPLFQGPSTFGICLPFSRFRHSASEA